MLLSLKALTLDAPLNQTGECLVLTELILPRPGIAKKSALKDLRLTKGKVSLARAPFYEKALLKEKVDGPFGIKVSITRPLKHPELNQFLKQLLATGIQGLGEAASFSAFPSLSISAFAKGLRELIEVPFDKVSNALESNDLSFLASGGIDLDSESLVPGPISIELKLEERIRLAEIPVGPKARDKRKSSAKIYKKGSAIGSVTFDLSV